VYIIKPFYNLNLKICSYCSSTLSERGFISEVEKSVFVVLSCYDEEANIQVIRTTHLTSPQMITRLSTGHDLVIGSRCAKGGGQIGVPFYRRVLSRGINIFSRFLFGLPVKDVTSGYQYYKANILRKIVDRYGPDFIESRGFEVAFELLVKAHKLGLSGFAVADDDFLVDPKRG
jgi:hypothetical protein